MRTEVATADNYAAPSTPSNTTSGPAQQHLREQPESGVFSGGARYQPEPESCFEDDHADGSSTVGSLVLPRLQTPRSPSPDPPRNTIWLTPTSLGSVNSQLRLHCTYQEPGPFVVHPPLGELDASPSCATLHEILERYGARIVSMELDASLFPNPKEEETIACPLELPLHPSPKLYGDQIYGVAPNLPYLTELKIHTARKVSTRSLLALLCATPALKKLEVENQALHQAVFPEDLGGLPQVNLGHLQQLTILGISSDTANDLLSKLCGIGPKVCMDIRLNPACPSGNIGPLRDTLSTTRHAHLSCDAIKRQKGGSDVYRVIFTDDDERSRFQLHWEWSVPHGVPPNLLHISLDPAALRNVRQLTVSLQRDIAPTHADWAAILRPFSSLRRLEVRAERSAPERPLEYVLEKTTFTVRGAPLLNMVADVPDMFALGLSHRFGPRKATPGQRSGLVESACHKLRRCLWRRMVVSKSV